MTKQENWLDRIPLDVISIVVMIASAFLDGRYLTRYSFVGVKGAIFAYTFNSVADLAVNKLSRSFVRLRLDRLSKWKQRLTWTLIPFWLLSFYFTLVFSWREAALQQPNEPEWLHWSIAAFAPTLLTGLGLAQALRDGKYVAAKVEVIDTEPEQVGKMPAPIGKLEPQPVAKLQGEALREAILDTKRANPGITYNEMADMFDSSPSTVGYHVRALADAGHIGGKNGG